ncbi:hypothetical protein ABZ208_05100 [Streptomyces sp. NPDC006208]|uniref:hypothetical protein n=1 Tax=Streptomyces sp. NPDC006208 TaxID=3156734 RepID=UPI0033A336D4
MLENRQISGMLRQIARQDVIELGPEMSRARIAALAHVAEHYGFEYADAHRTGQNKNLIEVQMYRDPRPEARAREAATIAAYTQAGSGGAVPGMRQGTLKPLPEAQEAVTQLGDRIAFDLMGNAASKRQMLLPWICVAALVITLLVCGMYIGAVAGGAALAAFLIGGVKIGEIRRQRIAQRLTDAGFVAVQDEHGRQRLLRPGQQLPGHANPFAG